MDKTKNNKQEYLDLSIKPVKDERDSLCKKYPELCKDGTIPIPGTAIIVGTTGSGKSVLIHNLITRKEFYGSFFKLIYLFCISESKMLSTVKQIKKEHIFKNGDPGILTQILDKQKKIIQDKGFEKAPTVLIICDDMASRPNFMNSAPLLDIFFGGTHNKVYLWVTAQSYVKVPRSMRTNAHSIFLFHGAVDTEIDKLMEEHRPGVMTKNQFREMVNYAIAKPNDFLFCNCAIRDKNLKFRRNFEEILAIN